MRDDYSPNAKSGKLFEERQALIPPPRAYAAEAITVEKKINDLELCLKGNPISKRWQEINVEMNRLKDTLLTMKRKLAGRTPQMKSWADPLP